MTAIELSVLKAAIKARHATAAADDKALLKQVANVVVAYERQAVLVVLYKQLLETSIMAVDLARTKPFNPKTFIKKKNENVFPLFLSNRLGCH